MTFIPQTTPSTLSSGNTSNDTLSSGATFSGDTEINSYQDVMIAVDTDQNGTLYADFSTDGINFD